MRNILLFYFLFSFLSANAQQQIVYNGGGSFSAIAVDSNFNIWAGTKAGVYVLKKSGNPNASSFELVAETDGYRINALASDNQGTVWVGNNGKSGTVASLGGIMSINSNSFGVIRRYTSSTEFYCINLFQENDGLASRYSASLAIDSNGTLWSAHRYHDLLSSPDYFVTPGGLSYKTKSMDRFTSIGTFIDYREKRDDPGLPYPAYTCKPKTTETPGTRNVYSVAAGKEGLWISVGPYTTKGTEEYLPSRLVRYGLDGKYIGEYRFTDLGFTSGGVFNGICISAKGDVWVTASAGKGIAVRKKGNWSRLSGEALKCILPEGAQLNPNAMWANKLGQVFIGTNKGLIVYNGLGSIDSVTSYSYYNRSNFSDLTSDNILGGASEKDSIQWIATDGGIIRTTLGGNYPSVKDTLGYETCNNPEINAIEAQDPEALQNRQDWHTYRVETIVARRDGPNGLNANAQYVYNMMKNDVTLTAPTPMDFPYDNMSTLLLALASKNTLDDIVSRVNQWEYNPEAGNESGGIKYIKQVMSPSDYRLYYIFGKQGKLPFTSLFDGIDRKEIDRISRGLNKKQTIACQEYFLYNSPNYVYDRVIFEKLSPCGWEGKLESVDYDKIWAVPNDKELTITNYTQPGHMLYPGKVVRQVIEECGVVKIITIGSGLNSCGNSPQGKMNGNGNIITGSILFKNIDIRLKQDFEKAIK